MSTKTSKLQQAAANPELRSATIAEFNRQRLILFCCAMLVTTGNLLMCVAYGTKEDGPALCALGAVLLWMVVFRIDSERRVLMLLDQVERMKAAAQSATQNTARETTQDETTITEIPVKSL